MLIKELLEKIEQLLPKATAMEGDRIGLQIQSGRQSFLNILVTMELDESVIDEAIEIGADLIVSFHPLIYKPLAEIIDEERVGNLTTKLIYNKIAMISLHTTFDAFSEGTSKIIADRLSLETVGFLLPLNNYNDRGMGVICKCTQPMTEKELLGLVAERLFAPIRYTGGADSKNIETIAIVGGSGSSFVNAALSAKVDAFITADITYHTFHAVKGKMLLIDPGHYEMEQFVGEAIANLLSNNLTDDIKINTSRCRTNPVNYFSSGSDYEKNQIEYLNNVKINRIN